MGTTERRHRTLLLRAGPVAALAVFAVFALLMGTAWAAWSAAGTGSGRVASQSVPQGNTPTVSLSVRNVTVSWAAVTLSGGTPAAGYRLARYPSTGTTAQSMTSCTGVIAALSCTETSVPVGSWRYTVTPVQGSWTGVASGYSATVVVVGPPALTALEMFDVNANGRIDRVVATFDKTLASYTAGTAPWTLANVPSGGSLSSVTVAGATATLDLTEGAGAANTAVGSFTVALAANANGVRGTDGQQASFAATSPTDKAAPARTAMVMQDLSGGDGFVDNVALTFSETLAAYSAGTAPWTLANVPSGSTLTGASISGSSANLALGSPSGAANTAVGSFTVALATSAAGVRDAAGNLSSFAATAPADGAGPAAVALSSAGGTGTTPGRLQAGDKLSVTLSEALGSSVTLSASVTLSLADPTTLTTDQLAVPSLFNGARSTGTDGYLNRNNTTASFAASTFTISADRKTVTVTVGPACAGSGCGRLRTVSSAAPVSVLLDTGLVDAAGNSPTIIARDISAILF